MMEECEVVSTWAVHPDLGNIAQIALDYPCRCRDATNQPCELIPTLPNSAVFFVQATTAVIDQIDADGWPILWREVIAEMPI